MNVLVFITNQLESIDKILAEMMEKKLSGATVVDCQGMLKSINESSVDPPPIFGSLRHFISPQNESTKMLLSVLSDEDVPVVRAIIHKHTGGLDKPNTGVLFEIPIRNVEGVPQKK